MPYGGYAKGVVKKVGNKFQAQKSSKISNLLKVTEALTPWAQPLDATLAFINFHRVRSYTFFVWEALQTDPPKRSI